jgi:CRISPR-associated protein Csx17
MNPLVALPLTGLNLDSLGNYLAALGLLNLARRKWPSVRGCWKDERFVLVGGPADLVELERFLSEIAEQRGWSAYEKAWDSQQKADTKAQSARNSSLWRANGADETELAYFHSHLATGRKLSFNPLFGTGGNSGKRDFPKGWERAAVFLHKPPRGTKREDLDTDLRAFLSGEPCQCLGDFNAACWFSAANKAFNSGTAKPFRDGQLTPWAMVLACEAFPLFRGSASRRLGSGRRAIGSFPFIVAPPAPETAGEAGRITGEAWLPVWHRPMSFPEVEAVFARGRAEVNGKGAVTAAAFAVAIVQRGIDAGLTEFRRFTLLRTTSENTFESRLTRIIPIKGRVNSVRAKAVGVALQLRESLPPDRKQGQRWIFAGLRGPVDLALTEYAATESTEDAAALVDAMVEALGKADHNRNHRARDIRFKLLPGAWLADLCEFGLGSEGRIALATASLWRTKSAETFLPYWLGATRVFDGWCIPENVPFRRVWAPTTLQANLAAVVERRLVDVSEATAPPPFQASLSAPLADVAAWLRGEIDEAELERWLLRFSLFDFDQESVATVRQYLSAEREVGGVTGEIAALALLKPLFEPQLFTEIMRDTLARKNPRCARVAHLCALLSRSDLATAMEFARQTWHAAGVRLMEGPLDYAPDAGGDFCQRLLGAMLMPVRSRDLRPVFRRWCAPVKTNESNP